MLDSLTDVPGVLAGHWTHDSGTTGVTVVLTPQGARGAAFVPGSASGSRELPALEPRHLATSVHGVCLAGGSAFGLAAADGVVRWLAERGHGFPTPYGPVPIVPAAILFDLHTATARPDADAGYAAARASSTERLPAGRVGAGAGAAVGAMWGASARGGTGTASTEVAGHKVGVVVAVNAAGGIRDPDTGAWLAGGPTESSAAPDEPTVLRGHTTLAVVATDAPLDRAQLDVVARMAAAGMARALSPAFTPFDGDVVVALSTAEQATADPVLVARVGHAAAEVLSRAIASVGRPS